MVPSSVKDWPAIDTATTSAASTAHPARAPHARLLELPELGVVVGGEASWPRRRAGASARTCWLCESHSHKTSTQPFNKSSSRLLCSNTVVVFDLRLFLVELSCCRRSKSAVGKSNDACRGKRVAGEGPLPALLDERSARPQEPFILVASIVFFWSHPRSVQQQLCDKHDLQDLL